MEVKEISKTNPEFLEEMRNWFNVKPEVVKKLPNPKEVRDNQSVLLETNINGVSELIEYTMIKGKWYKHERCNRKNC